MNDVLIDVRGLTIGWPGEDPLIDNVSFDVRRGEIFAILGGSGCGKSTLLRFLVGLETPSSGEILLDETALRGTRPPSVREALDGSLEARRPRFGVMFQQGALFGSMTVAENVALAMERWTDLPREAVAAMVRAKLRLVGLESAAHKLPSALSGGMKKRTAIARAMALEPALLFLDEPSSGLDPISSAGLDSLILTLQRVLGLTVVLVTHELGSIFSIVDRCIMLDRATKSIIATGDPRGLKTSSDPQVHAFFNRLPGGV